MKSTATGKGSLSATPLLALGARLAGHKEGVWLVRAGHVGGNHEVYYLMLQRTSIRKESLPRTLYNESLA